MIPKTSASIDAASQGPTTSRVDSWRFTTTNTKLAAALATAGLPLKRNDPVTNVHDKEHPARGGALGKVTYHFEAETKAGLEAKHLLAAWEGRTADSELDTALEALANSLPPGRRRAALEKQVKAIRELLPLAMLCYMRGALENRERLLDLIKQATPMVMIQRGQQTVLVSKNPPDAVRRRFRI